MEAGRPPPTLEWACESGAQQACVVAMLTGAVCLPSGGASAAVTVLGGPVTRRAGCGLVACGWLESLWPTGWQGQVRS